MLARLQSFAGLDGLRWNSAIVKCDGRLECQLQHLAKSAECAERRATAGSRGFPQAFQPRAHYLPNRPKQDRNRSVSGLRNVLVGRARFELAVSWSQTGD